HNRAEAPQRRDLFSIKPGRTGQSGNEHNRQRFRHGMFPAKNSAKNGAKNSVKNSAKNAADYRAVRKSEEIFLAYCTAAGAFRLTFGQSILCCGHAKKADSTAWRVFPLQLNRCCRRS